MEINLKIELATILISILLLLVLFVEVRLIQLSSAINFHGLKNLKLLKYIFDEKIFIKPQSSDIYTFLAFLISIVSFNYFYSSFESRELLFKLVMFLPVFDILFNFKESDYPYLINTLLIFILVSAYNVIPIVLLIFQFLCLLNVLKDRVRPISLISFVVHILFFLIVISFRTSMKLSLTEDLVLMILIIPVSFVIYSLFMRMIPRFGSIRSIDAGWTILVASVLLELIRI